MGPVECIVAILMTLLVFRVTWQLTKKVLAMLAGLFLISLARLRSLQRSDESRWNALMRKECDRDVERRRGPACSDERAGPELGKAAVARALRAHRRGTVRFRPPCDNPPA